jgi:hypothetical protein
VAGTHELRLMEFSADGDVIERGIWNLQVVADSGPNLSSDQLSLAQRFFNATIVLDGSYRIAEEDVDPSAAKHGGQGSISLVGSSQGVQWSTESSASFLYDSKGAQVGQLLADQQGGEIRKGRDLELAEYLLTAKSKNISAIIGHHQPAASSLLIQDFYRRGASVTGQNESKSLMATGFAYHTEPVSGFRFGAGIGQQNHRVAGSMVSVSPLTGSAKALTVTATYLDGAGEDHSGLGVGGVNIQPAGVGRSLAIASDMIDSRLQLRAERAETDYDFDGSKSDFQSEDGSATAFQGLFHIW